jgi:hypothetical protein
MLATAIGALMGIGVVVGIETTAAPAPIAFPPPGWP